MRRSSCCLCVCEQEKGAMLQWFLTSNQLSPGTHKCFSFLCPLCQVLSISDICCLALLYASNPNIFNCKNLETEIVSIFCFPVSFWCPLENCYNSFHCILKLNFCPQSHHVTYFTPVSLSLHIPHYLMDNRLLTTVSLTDQVYPGLFYKYICYSFINTLFNSVTAHHPLYDTCCMSCVTCHIASVICHMSL